MKFIYDNDRSLEAPYSEKMDHRYRADIARQRAEARAQMATELAQMRIKAAEQRIRMRTQMAEFRAQAVIERAGARQQLALDRQHLAIQRQHERAKRAAGMMSYSQALNSVGSNRFIPLSLAARKYNIERQTLRRWYDEGLLVHVRRTRTSQTADPCLHEKTLAVAITRLRRFERRQQLRSRLLSYLRVPHLHRYHQLRTEAVWSQARRQELHVSEQVCACGCERMAIRQPMLIGWRTVAIQSVPRGTWDVEVETAS